MNRNVVLFVLNDVRVNVATDDRNCCEKCAVFKEICNRSLALFILFHVFLLVGDTHA